MSELPDRTEVLVVGQAESFATDVPPVDGFYQEVRATTNPSRS